MEKFFVEGLEHLHKVLELANKIGQVRSAFGVCAMPFYQGRSAVGLCTSLVPGEQRLVPGEQCLPKIQHFTFKIRFFELCE